MLHEGHSGSSERTDRNGKSLGREVRRCGEYQVPGEGLHGQGECAEGW